MAKSKKPRHPDFSVSEVDKNSVVIRPKNEDLMDFLFGEYIDPTGQMPLGSLPRFIVADDAAANKLLVKLIEDGFTVGFFKRMGG